MSVYEGDGGRNNNEFCYDDFKMHNQLAGEIALIGVITLRAISHPRTKRKFH